MLCSSNEIGPKLLEALGISSNECISAVIILEANKPIIVEAKYYANIDASGNLIDISTEVKQFELVKKKDHLPGSVICCTGKYVARRSQSKRRMISMWTCSDTCHAEHKTLIAAWFHYFWLRITGYFKSSNDH